jgi:hypothetical protein
MRRIFIAIAMLLFFTANQAATAFEQCADASCMNGMMDAQKQSEHQKKDPACAAHCAIGSHHVAAMPQELTAAVPAAASPTPQWPVDAMPESACLDGPIEPPSLA